MFCDGLSIPRRGETLGVRNVFSLCVDPCRRSICYHGIAAGHNRGLWCAIELASMSWFADEDAAANARFHDCSARIGRGAVAVHANTCAVSFGATAL